MSEPGSESTVRREDAEARLETLQAVTDAALTRLTVEDLLDELLNRVRELLEVDTAAVLLLDEEAQQLVATTACGIEEEVRVGVRIPVGSGFAGRIAATKSAVVLDRVDTSTVANPILWETGIRVMLGVPLLAENRLIGVLHVGRLTQEPFGEDDLEILQVVGDRVAGAIQTRRLAVEKAAAAVLEKSLVPSRLPSVPGLEFAARYLTPQDRTVGGDWYDLFTTPSGELWIVTGDVAGHGLGAAVVMGRVRSALRAYSLLEGSPQTVLELTDRKVLHFEFGTVVTVVCAVSRPPYEQLEISLGGHLPPMLAAPPEAASILDLPVDPPLGVFPGIQRRSSMVDLSEGAVLLLYTDGLVERRTEPIDTGLERLRATLRADDPEAVCRDVLRTFIGREMPTDDVAIVAIRRRTTF